MATQQELEARSDEVSSLQQQLQDSQAETRDIKQRYARLATQAQELQAKLVAEVGGS